MWRLILLLVTLCYGFTIAVDQTVSTATHSQHLKHNHHRNRTILHSKTDPTTLVEAIPVLSVSFNYDPTNYIGKLIQSIDFPVRHLVLQLGNKNSLLTDEMLSNVHKAIANNSQHVIHSDITTLTHNPGSARGFNYGLSKMMEYHEDWVFVVNYDIEFYPGILRRLFRHMQESILQANKTTIESTGKTSSPYSNKPYFGVGMTGMCCGGEWSAIAFTRSLVDEVGYFDENYFPGYYEDDDYAMRIFRSKHYVKQFNDVILSHRELNGTHIYISGLWDNLNHLQATTKELKESKQRWKEAFNLGDSKARDYFYRKWGLPMNTRGERRNHNCKPAKVINVRCAKVWDHPFNNTNTAYSFWELEEDAKQRMESD